MSSSSDAAHCRPANSSSASVQEVALAIFRSAYVVGRRFVAGPWTPRIPAEHEWTVMARDGSVAVLAHDVFEVARYFCRLESGELPLEADAEIIMMPTDAEIEVQNFTERHWYTLSTKALEEHAREHATRALRWANLRARLRALRGAQ